MLCLLLPLAVALSLRVLGWLGGQTAAMGVIFHPGTRRLLFAPLIVLLAPGWVSGFLFSRVPVLAFFLVTKEPLWPESGGPLGLVFG